MYLVLNVIMSRYYQILHEVPEADEYEVYDYGIDLAQRGSQHKSEDELEVNLGQPQWWRISATRPVLEAGQVPAPASPPASVPVPVFNWISGPVAPPAPAAPPVPVQQQEATRHMEVQVTQGILESRQRWGEMMGADFYANKPRGGFDNFNNGFDATRPHLGQMIFGFDAPHSGKVNHLYTSLVAAPGFYVVSSELFEHANDPQQRGGLKFGVAKDNLGTRIGRYANDWQGHGSNTPLRVHYARIFQNRIDAERFEHIAKTRAKDAGLVDDNMNERMRVSDFDTLKDIVRDTENEVAGNPIVPLANLRGSTQAISRFGRKSRRPDFYRGG